MTRTATAETEPTEVVREGFDVLVANLPPLSGHDLPADAGDPQPTYDSALSVAEAWARAHPRRSALVHHLGTNEVASVVYRPGEASVVPDPETGEDKIVYAPGQLEVVFDHRDRPVLSIEPHPEQPWRNVITQAAGLEGDHAAFAKYDTGHPTVKDRTDYSGQAEPIPYVAPDETNMEAP